MTTRDLLLSGGLLISMRSPVGQPTFGEAGSCIMVLMCSGIVQLACYLLLCKIRCFQAYSQGKEGLTLHPTLHSCVAR